LGLVAAGVGDTYVPRAHTRAASFPRGLKLVSFDPPVYETFAMVVRRGVSLSPATAAFGSAIKSHMAGLAGLEPL
jgi:DNA-binding transcriptional LysR family regulator